MPPIPEGLPVSTSSSTNHIDASALLRALEELRDSASRRLRELSGAIERLRVQAAELNREYRALGERDGLQSSGDNSVPWRNTNMNSASGSTDPSPSLLNSPPRRRRRPSDPYPYIPLPAVRPPPASPRTRTSVNNQEPSLRNQPHDSALSSGGILAGIYGEVAGPTLDQQRTERIQAVLRSSDRLSSRENASIGSARPVVNRGRPATNSGSRHVDQPTPTVVRTIPATGSLRSANNEEGETPSGATTPTPPPNVSERSPQFGRGALMAYTTRTARMNAVSERAPETSLWSRPLRTSDPSLTTRGVRVASRLDQASANQLEEPVIQVDNPWLRSWLVARHTPSTTPSADAPIIPPPGPANLQEARRLADLRWGSGNSPMQEENRRLQETQRLIDALSRGLDLLERRYMETIPRLDSAASPSARSTNGIIGPDWNTTRLSQILRSDNQAEQVRPQSRAGRGTQNEEFLRENDENLRVSRGVGGVSRERLLASEERARVREESLRVNEDRANRSPREVPPPRPASSTARERPAVGRQAVTVINTRRRAGPLPTGERYLREVDPEHTILTDYPDATIRIMLDESRPAVIYQPSEIPRPEETDRPEYIAQQVSNAFADSLRMLDNDDDDDLRSMPGTVYPESPGSVRSPLGERSARRLITTSAGDTVDVFEHPSPIEIDNTLSTESQPLLAETSATGIAPEVRSQIARQLRSMASLRADLQAIGEGEHRDTNVVPPGLSTPVPRESTIPIPAFTYETFRDAINDSSADISQDEAIPRNIRFYIRDAMGQLDTLEATVNRRRTESDRVMQRASDTIAESNRLLADIERREGLRLSGVRMDRDLDAVEGPTVSSPVTASGFRPANVEIEQVDSVPFISVELNLVDTSIREGENVDDDDYDLSGILSSMRLPRAAQQAGNGGQNDTYEGVGERVESARASRTANQPNPPATAAEPTSSTAREIVHKSEPPEPPIMPEELETRPWPLSTLADWRHRPRVYRSMLDL